MDQEVGGSEKHTETDKDERSIQWTHVKRKLAPDAELFEEGNIICNLTTKQLPVESDYIIKDRENKVCCGIAGCNKILDSLTSYEMHYSSIHKNVCCNCKRNFPSAHLLDIHILEWHDSMFELLSVKQPMFQCLVESCTLKFSNRKCRKNHMIKVHKYPANYRFDRPFKQNNVMKVDNSMEIETSILSQHAHSELLETNKAVQSSGRKFSYKVPENICFGQGSMRGFVRGRGRGGRGGKCWHNKGATGKTAVNIESVDMKDLASALDIK